MRIETERIDKLFHYVIRDGIASAINVEPTHTAENHANIELENTIADEQQKRGSATHKQLKNAIENAQIIGHKGEEFVNYYLKQQKKLGLIKKMVWEANTNAIAPYDFIIEQNGSKVYIDVKSTEGEFSNPIHISYNELLEMRKDQRQYHLYRIYAMSNAKANLLIIKDLRNFAKEVLRILGTLPDYVKSDGITLSLSNREFAKFGGELTIHRVDTQE